MIETQNIPKLSTSTGAVVPLQGVAIEANLRDLLAEVTVKQTYRNTERTNIEAVYTFPLPLEAVLLNLTVAIGERILTGIVVEKHEAEERYEDALTDGDTAVMLELVMPGMYTMNLGNLQPNEYATISFTFALICKWQGDSLRFFLPTTIAPKYGSPSKAGLQPHQEIQHSILHRNEYTLMVRVYGLLRFARIESPSHSIAWSTEEDATIITLQGGRSVMDRDFILVLAAKQSYRDSARYEPDGDSNVVLASFMPVFPESLLPKPGNFKIVVDCSGSMAGDSISQACIAVAKIINSLRPEDFFSIVAFGSDHQALFDRQVSANVEHLIAARELLRRMEANMGGTEIASALEAAYHIPNPKGKRGDVLLITDGEVYNTEETIRAAKKSKHRVFTVGVGSSVSEAFLRELAEQTGGACELVSPRENMAESIYRHFRRIGAPMAKSVSISWPAVPIEVFPKTISTLFAGDTIRAFARFKGVPEGMVTLRAELPNGSSISQTTTVLPLPALSSNTSILPRVFAETIIRSTNDDELAKDLALKYNLISYLTNYLVIDKRPEGERAADLPWLRRVPNTLAAGWGGTGRVSPDSGGIRFCMRRDSPGSGRKRDVDSPSKKVNSSLSFPTFLRRHADEVQPVQSSPVDDGFDPFIAELNRIHGVLALFGLRVSHIHDLELAGLPKKVLTILRKLVKNGADESSVVVLFLTQLRESRYGGSLSRNTNRAIAKAYKMLQDHAPLEKKMRGYSFFDL